MFENGRNNMLLSFLCKLVWHTLDCPVVRFAAAGGKEDFFTLSAQGTGDLLACVLDGGLGLIADGIQAGRISVIGSQIGEHSLYNVFRWLRGSRMIGIYKSFQSLLLP